eukprot:749161-Hanusia_phi.AAC.2
MQAAGDQALAVFETRKRCRKEESSQDLPRSARTASAAADQHKRASGGTREIVGVRGSRRASGGGARARTG